MFESLYTRPWILAKHRNAPLAVEREKFLQHLANRNLAVRTLQLVACELLTIVQWMPIGRGNLTVSQIEAAADSWARHQRRRKRARALRSSRKAFKSIAVGWMAYLGKLAQPRRKRSRYAKLVEPFEAFMREERGLAEATIRYCCWHAEKFLDYLGEADLCLKTISASQVDVYLSHKGATGWSRASLLTCANALRSFLRYSEQRRWCGRISAGVVVPRVYQQERLTRGLEWQAAQQLIASSAGDSRRDIRDHAILMLLALYGLRSGEIASLRLEDVDWEHDTLWVRRQKQRRTEQYPLTAIVGEALLRYLREVRPRCDCRELFLTLNAPYRPLPHSSRYYIVRSRLDALGIQSSRRGPHCLRHACANHLLASGFSLKQIGDHLGHRSAYATRIYAKVDLRELRQVAEIDIRGLL
jgi:integrase/recombinase XerD